MDQMLRRTSFINYINCAVWQFAVIDIACSQFDRGFDCLSGVFYRVMFLKIRLDATQDFYGVLDRRFIHVDLLETAA